MANDGFKIDLENCAEVKAFWRESCKNGAAFLTAAQKIIRNYIFQEKQNGRRVSEEAKVGIYAYHFNYADQAIERLEKIPPEQNELKNELHNIQVSHEFIQQMAPEMSEWEKLHYFQYGTVVHDLSGQPVAAVKAAVTGVYWSAWMGLTHQKFKEQANFFERICSAPIIMEPVGPMMVYRKFGKRGLNYFFLDPSATASHERE